MWINRQSTSNLLEGLYLPLNAVTIHGDCRAAGNRFTLLPRIASPGNYVINTRLQAFASVCFAEAVSNFQLTIWFATFNPLQVNVTAIDVHLARRFLTKRFLFCAEGVFFITAFVVFR
jgi:hypothetical protein